MLSKKVLLVIKPAVLASKLNYQMYFRYLQSIKLFMSICKIRMIEKRKIKSASLKEAGKNL